VTTTVGMICSDGLVVASDSQATRGPSMREEYLKIWDLQVNPKLPALITGAGRGAYIAKYRELLQDACSARAESQPIRTVSEFVRVAEATMQELALM
jgi:20S proteasome alpha/beta subunit